MACSQQNPDYVKPCEICGDIGYEGCIKVCCRCKITREHLYCMIIVDDSGRDDWVCGGCESQNPLPSSKPDTSKQPDNTRSNIRRPPPNTKVQYIPVEEAMVLETGAQKKLFSSPSKANVSVRPMLNRTPPAKTETTRDTTAPPRYTHDRPPGFPKLPSTSSLPNTSQDKNKTVTDKNVAKKQLHLKDSSAAIRHTSIKPQTSNVRTEDRNKRPARNLWQETPSAELPFSGKVSETNSDIQNIASGQASTQSVQSLSAMRSDKGPCRQPYRDTSAGLTSYLEQIPKFNAEIDVENTEKAYVQSEILAENSRMVLDLDTYLPNHPAEFPMWKGTFNIARHFFDGIQAHPPCKVQKKVYDFSKKLPGALKFELLPRLNIWVNLFNNDVPGALDIGLYFLFPKSSFVEMLNEQDMVLRSQIKGVELFVFSSRHLPEHSQRINKEFFLWGLFRSSQDNVVAEGEKSAEDIDIDMSGSYEMGVVDKVVPKVSKESNPGPTVPGSAPLEKDSVEACPNPSAPASSLLRKDRTEPVLPSTASAFQDEIELMREAQRSFDRHFTLTKPLKIKVKDSVEACPNPSAHASSLLRKDRTEPILPSTASAFQDEIELMREAQRSFDRHFTSTKPLKIKVKEEPGSPGRK